jgi:histidine triad (HIT) family protein
MSSCIFCKILKGEIPAAKVHETEHAIVIKDIQPQAPMHWLVIPRHHVASLNDLDDRTRVEILPSLYAAADAAANAQGIRDKGYRTVINNQSLAGQTVFHLHMHVLTGSSKALGHFGE